MSDTILRLTFFLSILIILIMAEILFPKKKRIHNRKDRWITNGLITLINTASVNIVHIAIPLIAIVAAIDVSNGKMGLFNIINFPIWIEIILTVIILDFIIWGQHLLSHKIPFVSASALGWEGQLIAFDFASNDQLCLNCIIDKNSAEPIMNCGNSGVVGPVLGAMGSLQATTAIRMLLGYFTQHGQIQRYDGKNGQWLGLVAEANQHCVICGTE